MSAGPLRVFVSSTMEELREERGAIRSALEQLYVSVFVYERKAGARPGSPRETFMTELADSQVYIGVFGRRYGDWTIEEYREAVRRNLPCFLYRKEDGIEPRDPRLEAFLTEVDSVTSGHTVGRFVTPKDLGDQVRTDLSRWLVDELHKLQVLPPPPPASPEVERDFGRLAESVRQLWVDGVLRKILAGHSYIQVERRIELGPVAHPLDDVLPALADEARVLPPATPLADVFRDNARSLLILGEPGSGKTVALLELARDLLRSSERDRYSTLPVVLHLSTWSRGERLGDWIVVELRKLYTVPAALGRAWLQGRRLVPLLDGLDEVAPQWREECVRSINAFLYELGPPGVCVCSRSEAYAGLSTRLALHAAVRLQPLQQEVVRDYLARETGGARELASVLEQDAELQSLARTPLMLGILAQAGAMMKGSPGEPSKEPRPPLDRIFDVYIEQMISRKGPRMTPAERARFLRRLSWLARRMIDHRQTIFLLEEVQPSWLRRGWPNVFYFAASRTPIGAVMGVLLLSLVSAGFFLGPWASTLGLGALLGGACGLTAGLLDATLTGRQAGLRGWRRFLLYLPACTAAVSLVLYVAGTGSSLVRVLFASTVSLVLATLLSIGQPDRPDSDIQSIETLHWSWRLALRRSFKDLAFGLAVAAVLAIPYLLLAKVDAATRVILAAEFLAIGGMVGGVLGAVSGGFRPALLETRTRPNEGIRRSGRNALLLGGIALLCGTALLLVVDLLYKVELTPSIAILAGFSLGFAVFLLFGGTAVIRHYTLRVFLRLSGQAPLDWTPFLDHASDRLLLRRAGGGYLFIHRTLLDHFAAGGDWN